MAFATNTCPSILFFALILVKLSSENADSKLFFHRSYVGQNVEANGFLPRYLVRAKYVRIVESSYGVVRRWNSPTIRQNQSTREPLAVRPREFVRRWNSYAGRDRE